MVCILIIVNHTLGNLKLEKDAKDQANEERKIIVKKYYDVSCVCSQKAMFLEDSTILFEFKQGYLVISFNILIKTI